MKYIFGSCDIRIGLIGSKLLIQQTLHTRTTWIQKK